VNGYISPDQVEAVKSSQVAVDHATFRTGKSLTPLHPPLISPTIGLALLVGVVGLAIWFGWARSFVNRRWHWPFTLVFLSAALVVAGLEISHHRPPPLVSTALVSEPLRIDKSWHGIHFLLTGSARGGSPPLYYAVLGGREFGMDFGYGPARYLTPDQVKEVAAALDGITKDSLRARFNPKAMTKANIYSWLEDEGEEGLEYFLYWYVEVRRYFLDAASKGNGMLLCVF